MTGFVKQLIGMFFRKEITCSHHTLSQLIIGVWNFIPWTLAIHHTLAIQSLKLEQTLFPDNYVAKP